MARRTRITSEEALAARRRARRLREELGINPAGVEVILRLRSQVMELQAQLQQTNLAMTANSTRRSVRLVRYRETTIEAEWRDNFDVGENGWASGITRQKGG
jgi:hypothetical protein